MRRITRFMLCTACAAGLGFGIITPLAQKRAIAADAAMMQKKDIIDTAVGPGMQEVTTVVTAIKAADLVDTLKGKGPFTVFAPTNAAFNKLPAGTVDDLLKPENKAKLKDILLYHVHAGDAIMAKDVKTMKLTTAEGKDLDVKVDGGIVWVNNAKVIKTDVICSNGVIHWIDAVVMPPEK
jgi:transforming growth factor-beta-induced protein